MSTHLQLVLGLWFTAMCVFGVVCFLGWLLWSLFWDLYDHLAQQRRRLNRFDSATQRTAFKDVKGLTK